MPSNLKHKTNSLIGDPGNPSLSFGPLGASGGGKVGRRSTLRGGDGSRGPSKNKAEEKESQGDVEGKSFFKCSYNRRHLGAEISEREDEDEGYGGFTRSPGGGLYGEKKDPGAGCLSCKA